VDDVLQEILVRVHNGFEALDGEAHFSRWLYRVASNVILDQHRRHQRQERKLAALAGAPHRAEGPDEDAQAELAAFVGVFIGLLPSPYQEALRQVELEGLSIREAALQQGLSESGMKSRVQRGRRMLRELFEACCEIALDARNHVHEVTPRGQG
jgi:RNA polymerase sigma-70 factor (ECF subfamily)